MPATHSGTVSITDVTAVDTDGNDVAKGGNINISFVPVGSALTTCTGTGQAGCQIGTNPPVGTCFTRVLPKAAASPPTVDVGAITITTSLASNASMGQADSGTTTAELFERATASAPFPTCFIRNGAYLCLSLEGTGGDVAVAMNAAGTFVFNPATSIGDGGVDPASAADRGRTLVANINGTLVSLPILLHPAPGTIAIFSTVAIAAPVGIWRVVHGGGPVPIAASGPDPFIQFLRDSDLVRIQFPGNANFSATDKTVAVGDTFTLNAATKTFLASLEDRSDITARMGDFALGCQTGQCGGTAAAGGGSATGTLLVLEATTNTAGGDLRIITQCSGISSPTVNVIGTHWDFIRTRAANLDSLRATIFRPIFDPKTETGTRPPNTTNYLVGHGFVRDVKSADFVP